MVRDETRNLIQALVNIQNVHYWKDQQMAAKLTISRSGWCAARRGHSRLGSKVLGRILINFPELRDHVANYLIEGIDD